MLPQTRPGSRPSVMVSEQAAKEGIGSSFEWEANAPSLDWRHASVKATQGWICRRDVVCAAAPPTGNDVAAAAVVGAEFAGVGHAS